jgi:hypothetical protein
MSRSVLLILRTVSDKNCRENQNIFRVPELLLKNHAFYEIMWENIVQPDRPQMTV